MIYVGIVGAGKGGTSLLKTLMNVDEVEVIGIADLDSRAPGMKLAREMNIFTTQDCSQLLQNPQKKIIIEATGVEAVKKRLHNLADSRTEILDSSSALLMMLVVESREGLIQHLEEQSGQMAGLAQELSQTIHQVSSSSENKVSKLHQSLSSLSQVTDRNENHLSETHEILSFIKRVAGQTKLLGLNASIEATRAGNEGKGFGVVATEIRKLAEDSSKSAQRINDIINLITSSTEETLHFVNQIEGQISNFVEHQSEYTLVLERVAEQVENLARSLDEISCM